MAGFADLLAERTHARVLLPTHPGFGGTPKPERLNSVTDLARRYVEQLDQLDLTDVTVIGNSFGGWLAAEIALQHSPRVSGAVIIDGIGIEVDGHPIDRCQRPVRRRAPGVLLPRPEQGPACRRPAPPVRARMCAP